MSLLWLILIYIAAICKSTTKEYIFISPFQIDNNFYRKTYSHKLIKYKVKLTELLSLVMTILSSKFGLQ